MNAEKHVMPILLIIVVLLALVCTYAWFSGAQTAKVAAILDSGARTAFAISEGEGGEGGDTFDGEDLYTGLDGSGETRGNYSGQKGYHSDGTVYVDADKPYFVFKTISYLMTGQSDVTVDVALEKLIVKVGEMYLYSFNDTLKKAMGLTDEQIAALTNETRLNYYVEYTNAMQSDVNAITAPTGANPNSIYMVYNSSTSKVIYIVFEKTIVDRFVTFDYWVSDGTSNDGLGIIPNDNPALNPTSKKTTGIHLQYLPDGQGNPSQGYDGIVCESGYTNYVGVYVGFFGYDGVKYTECLFADNKFQGSEFHFMFSAGGV